RLWQIRGPNSWMMSVAFSPDGKALLVPGIRGGLTLWRADSGQKMRDIGADTEGKLLIRPTIFLPDGKSILSREFQPGGPTQHHEIRLWESDSGRLLRSFHIATNNPNYETFALSPDGKML